MSFRNPEIAENQKVKIKSTGLYGIVLANYPGRIDVVMDNREHKIFEGRDVEEVLPVEKTLYSTIKQSDLEDLEYSDYPEKPGFDVENLYYKLMPKVGGKKTDKFDGINIDELGYDLKDYIYHYKKTKTEFEN
jgi:hypothetical protein